MEEHQAVNRAMWGERAPAHEASSDDVYGAPEILGRRFRLANLQEGDASGYAQARQRVAQNA